MCSGRFSVIFLLASYIFGLSTALLQVEEEIASSTSNEVFDEWYNSEGHISGLEGNEGIQIDCDPSRDDPLERAAIVDICKKLNIDNPLRDGLSTCCAYSIVCNDDYRVTELRFSYVLSQNASLPSTIRDLTHLETFSLLGTQNPFFEKGGLITFEEKDLLKDLTSLRIVSFSGVSFSQKDWLPYIRSEHVQDVEFLRGNHTSYELQNIPYVFPRAQTLRIYNEISAWNNYSTPIDVSPLSSTLITLDLSANGMPSISDSICLCLSLSSLDLSRNKITTLPTCMTRLTHLHILGLGYNLIDDFPSSLLEANPNLKGVSLFPNNFRHIPDSISYAAASEMVVSGEYIETISSQISKVKGISRIYIKDTPNLHTIGEDVLNSETLTDFTVFNAPLLTTLPSLKHTRGVGTIIFSKIAAKEVVIPLEFISESHRHFEVSHSHSITDVRLGPIANNASVFLGPFQTEIVSFQNCSLRSLSEKVLRLFTTLHSLDLSYNPFDLPGFNFNGLRSSNLILSNTKAREIWVGGHHLDLRNNRDVVYISLTFSGTAQQQFESSVDYRGSVLPEGSYIILNEENLERMGPTNQPRFPLSRQLIFEKRLLCYPVGISFHTMYSRPIFRVTIDPEQLNYKHCTCMDKDMYWDPVQKLCLYRIQMGTAGHSPVVFEYNQSVTLPLHSVDSGFYPVMTIPGTNEVKFCDVDTHALVNCSFMPCIYQSRCNPSHTSSYTCAGGFSRDSIMCSKCPRGSYESLGVCSDCPSSADETNPLWAVALVLCLGVYVYRAHSHDSKKSYKPSFASVAIFISWVQTSRTFVAISHTGWASRRKYTTADQWWDSLSGFFYQWLPTATSCTVPEFDFILEAWLTMSAPVALVVIFGLVILTLWVFNALKPRYLSLLLYTFFFLMQTLYISVSSISLQLLSCIEVEGVSVLSSAPYIHCTSPRLHAILPFAYLMIPLFVVGVPLLLFYVVFSSAPLSTARSWSSYFPYMVSSKRSKSERPEYLKASFQMFGACHRPQYAFWAVLVVMARRVMVVSVVSLIHPQSAVIPFCILLILLCSLLLQLFFRPYAHRLDNTLESSLLILNYMTYASGAFSSVDELQDIEVLYMTAITINVLILLLFVLLIPFIRWGIFGERFLTVENDEMRKSKESEMISDGEREDDKGEEGKGDVGRTHSDDELSVPLIVE